MDARNAGVEADGVRVADEVDLVPAIRQLQAQLGGHDAATAIRWIAGDSDLHGATIPRCGTSVPRPIWPLRFSSGEGRSPPPNHTRTTPFSISTDGSQSTLLSHACSPEKTYGSFLHLTPSSERAIPSRRFSCRSRPV